MLFDFLCMARNYEGRKVNHYEQGELIVDTCAVSDADKDYETAVVHPKYNGGEWIVVELYDTKKEAQIGHVRWVKKMTAKKLPVKLTDVSTAEVAEICDVFNDKKSWRIKEKQ
jgi:hypothetical protein